MTGIRGWRLWRGGRTNLAWCNLKHRRARTLAALIGVSVAILLTFMQLGFFAASKTSATLVLSLLDFDAALVSPSYAMLVQSGSLPRSRLQQAAAVPGIAAALPLRIGPGEWRNAETGNRYDALVLGIDPADRPFGLASLNRQVPLLKRPDTALVDAMAHPMLGPLPVGTRTEVSGRRIEVVGDYSRGVGFIANGVVIVGESTFFRLFPELPSDMLQLVLLRFSPDADRAAVSDALKRTLPEDTLVWSRREIEGQDVAFFMSDRPIGLIFTSGVLVAFTVGAVILFQVLSSEVSNHLPELATLKALGYTPQQIRSVIVGEGFLLALIGFIPAAALSVLLYSVVRAIARLPVFMTGGRLILVLVLALGMCAVAGLLAARRVDRADPADLF